MLTTLAACTLSTEDWVKSEENKGYGELETISNEYMKLEYQYKSDTRSLTDSIQQYIINVEADSIIYFMDNLPQEWVPKAGKCVVANCCELFPMGLVGRVLSVERREGMYKVVTTPAELDDAFEDFNLDLDTKIFTDNTDVETIDSASALIDDAARAKAMSLKKVKKRPSRRRITHRKGADGKEEIVNTDWTMYDLMTGKTKLESRGSLEDDYDKDVDETKSETTELKIFEVKGGSWARNLNATLGNILNQTSVGCYCITDTKIHKIVNLKQKREFTDMTVAKGWKTNLIIGYDFPSRGNDAGAETEAKILAQMHKFEQKNPTIYATLAKDEVGKMEKIQNLSIVAEIPLPLPFGIVIQLKPILEPYFGMIGTGSMTLWSSKDRTITDIVDGKKVRDENTTMTPPSNDFSVTLGGKASIDIGAELFIGVGKRIGLDKAAGVGVYANYRIVPEFNAQFIISNNSRINDASNVISINGKGTIGGKVIAGDWVDVSFLEHEWKLKPTWEKSFFPRIDFNDTGHKQVRMVAGKDNNGDYYDVTMTYKFTDLGIHSTTNWTARTRPYMCIYNKQVTGEPDELLEPWRAVNKLEKNTDYTFQYRYYLNSSSSNGFMAVPAFKDPAGELVIYNENSRFIDAEALMPMIEFFDDYNPEYSWYDIAYQTWGDELSEDDEEYEEYLYDFTNTYYLYEVCLPFKLYNASSISDYWEDWGIEYTTSSNLDAPYGKKISLKKAIKKSGTYAPRIKILSTIDANKKSASVRLTPYYISKSDHQKYYLTNYTQSLPYMKTPYCDYKKGPGKYVSDLVELKRPCDDSYDWESKVNFVTIKP